MYGIDDEPDSLPYNRRGALSPRQKAQLAREARWNGCTYVGLGAMVAGISSVSLYGAWRANAGAPAIVATLTVLLIMLLVIVGFSAAGGVRALQLRRDLAEGVVAHADGEVAWRGGRYVAHWPGRPWWAGSVGVPYPAGHYRFYYLPRSGRLLAAEPLAVGPSPAQAAAEVLRGVYHHGPNEAQANQAGRLSARQRAVLAAVTAGYGLLAVVVIGLVAFVVRGLFASWPDGWFGSAFAVLLFGAAAWYLADRTLRLAADVVTGSVDCAAGPVRKHMEYGRYPRYYFDVAGQRLEVSRRAYMALAPGRPYSIYFTPRGRYVVGVVGM